MLEVKHFTKPRTLLQWLADQEKLDLSPSYQRRSDLWSLEYKQLLINSVLNNYDIPKIYIADFTYSNSKLNESRRPYAMIDGKQRFSTFFSFFKDELALDATPVSIGAEAITLKGLRYTDLKDNFPELARRVEAFVPTVMSVISDNLEEIQELFIRLNLNVSISGPERRNAMPGPLPHLIRELSVHEFFRVYATFPISRGQDLNAAAKFLLMEESGGFVSTKKKDLDRFVHMHRSTLPGKFSGSTKAVSTNLAKMTRVFQKRDPLLGGQAQIPIYYWLARNSTAKPSSSLRQSIEIFEDARAKARAASLARAQGKDVKSPSDTFVQYNKFVRSPDDKRSQQFMFDTLCKFVE